MKYKIEAKYDVVIIGSGISGLICALELAASNKNICIITKEAVTESSSLYAQGGIAIPIGENDSIEKHLLDTLKAATPLCNTNIAKDIINSAPLALEKLTSYGIKFDENEKNKIHQSKEGAHSVPRVCHVGGDATGKYVTKTLIDKVCRRSNIFISQGTIALSIIQDTNGKACGVLVSDITRNNYIIAAKNIILASGGIGQIYKNTTNPIVSSGDGVIMAFRSGATLQDIEMIQFHPTVLIKENTEPLLISEAVRGEGAKLKNINGEYFAKNYHELGELSPRDILVRAILYEMTKTNSNYVYLDLSNFSPDYFKKRFPTIYESCTQRKIDLFKTGIPISPGAHYFIGGIKTNLYGQTNIEGLWAIGEVASNGFHGANRLASNSLLECIVVPHFLTKKLLTEENDVLFNDKLEIKIDNKHYNENELKQIKTELQEYNLLHLGPLRKELELKNHLLWLNNTSCVINTDLISEDYQAQEIKNMLLLSKLICQAALFRNHSLGAHFREDYPEKPKEYKHTILDKNRNFLWENETSPKELATLLK